MKSLVLLTGAGLLFGLFQSGAGQTPAQRTGAGASPGATAFFITFGNLQERESDYSGTLSASDGRVVELIPWRFFGSDRMQGQNTWTLRTSSANMENQPDRPHPLLSQGPNRNIVPKGITAVVEASASATIRVQTQRAVYSFHLSELGGGHVLRFEDGDVAVQSVPAPSRVSPAPVEGATAEHDYPSLAVASDGSAWMAWQTYEGGGDRLFVVHSTASGWSAPEPLTPSGQDLYRTAVAVDGRGNAWVIWSQRAGEAWDLMGRSNNGSGWTAVRKITNGGEPNFFHRLVRDRSGNLHLIWIGYQNGESHVMWSKLSGEQWSPAQEISGANAWMPDAAADSAGNLYVAWDSYRTGNYDIFLRRIGADGAMGTVEQVTKSPSFQAHASLAVDGRDRVWLAWDESGANWGKDFSRDETWRGTTLYADRRPRVAVLENGRWLTPVADPMAAMPARYNRYAETPKLTCDRAGRIWMAVQARTSTAINRSDFWANLGRWNTFLTAYEGDHWRPAAQVPNSSGRPDGIFQLAPVANGVWAAWTNDNRLFPAAEPGEANLRRNEIDFARLDDKIATTEPSLQAFAETPMEVAPVHPREEADVQRVRAYRVETPQGGLRILRGDFHRHTEISPDGAGDGSLEDYFRYMMDAARMDTGIVSDHNAGGQEYTWWRTEKAIDLFHVAGAYTPLFGYERSVPYPNGHRNVVFAERGVKVLPISRDELQGKVNSGPVLYPYLKKNRGVCMLHSLATDQGSDYRDNDPEVEPLVEIYQGYHANYEYAGAPRAESPGYHVNAHGPYRPLGFYWNALAKDYKLGVESSSDHISTHSSYTMIYTPSMDRRDIVESMRKRHAYGATDNIVLDVRARDRQGQEHLMGDSFDAATAPALHVKVLGTGAIQSVEIVKNGKFIYRTEPNSETAEFDFSDNATSAGQSWYYVRVIQSDRNLAWSSPIWVRYPGR